MQLGQEELIAEILGMSPSGDYCYWPRRAASPPEIATLKSRLRELWVAGDYQCLARYQEAEAEIRLTAVRSPPATSPMP